MVSGSTEGFRFVSDHQADYPIASMCRLRGVSSSGYYAWMKRRPSRRSETDAALIGEIRACEGPARQDAVLSTSASGNLWFSSRVLGSASWRRDVGLICSCDAMCREVG